MDKLKNYYSEVYEKVDMFKKEDCILEHRNDHVSRTGYIDFYYYNERWLRMNDLQAASGKNYMRLKGMYTTIMEAIK